MAMITIKQPGGPYNATLDTGAMDVDIREAFLGVRFITESGRTLSVSMRDGGFEIKEGKL